MNIGAKKFLHGSTNTISKFSDFKKYKVVRNRSKTLQMWERPLKLSADWIARFDVATGRNKTSIGVCDSLLAAECTLQLVSACADRNNIMFRETGYNSLNFLLLRNAVT